MNITIITSYYHPEITPATHLLLDLANDFVKYGNNVTVATNIPSRGIDEKIRVEYIKKNDMIINNNLRIIRVGGGVEDKSLFFRAISYVKKVFVLYNKAKTIPTDVYFIVSTPPFIGIAGAFLSRKAPTVYNLQDVFPDSLITAKKLSEDSLIIRLFRKVEKWIYKKNTHIITISEDIKETLKNRGVSTEKVSVIHNWIDARACMPIIRNENILFERFALSRDNFYVSYAGNIGLLQNVETIIKAAETLEKTHPDIKFVIIGDGAWKVEMNRILAEKKLKNVLVFPMQPVEDVSYIYSLGDIEIVTLKPHMTRSALPSKTWSIMAAARPIICEIDLYSKLCDVIYENNCGVCVAPGDAQSMSEAIIRLYNKKESLPEMGANGRRYVEEKLSREFATKKYFDKLTEIVSATKKG